MSAQQMIITLLHLTQVNDTNTTCRHGYDTLNTEEANCESVRVTWKLNSGQSDSMTILQTSKTWLSTVRFFLFFFCLFFPLPMPQII